LNAKGLVIYEDQVLTLDVGVTFEKGTGEVFVSGPVDEGIEKNFNRAFEFAHNLADLEEFILPDFSGIDIHLRFGLAIPDVPIVGDSYGLALTLALCCACEGMELNENICITGCLDHNGDIVVVEGIERKRFAAAKLGYRHIMLPAGQLDYFNKDIDQIPVRNVFEAWTSISYGD
jgi:ATP-dependent Lon protease